MQKLMEAVLAIAENFSPDRVEQLSSAIETSSESSSTTALAQSAANPKARELVDRLVNTWAQTDVERGHLAGIVRGAAAGFEKARADQDVQLVWTGPDTQLVAVRRSEQVLKQLIDSAKREIFIVSFVSFNLPSIELAIKGAIESGVRVQMLLESEDRDGSDLFSKTIDRYKKEFPGLELYIWPAAKREPVGQGLASVHAKCAVADGEQLFVTSANLTGAAMDKNIEIGVFVRGGKTPADAIRQFQALITTGQLELA